MFSSRRFKYQFRLFDLIELAEKMQVPYTVDCVEVDFRVAEALEIYRRRKHLELLNNLTLEDSSMLVEEKDSDDDSTMDVAEGECTMEIESEEAVNGDEEDPMEVDNTSGGQDYLSAMPLEIIFCVVDHLDYCDIIRLVQVSKAFNRLVKAQEFWK